MNDQVEKRSLAVRGLTFDVFSGGPADGEPVLLLHGFPQHSGEWDLVTPHLHAAGLRTYAFDQRGYSPGARPAAVEAYRMDELVADVLAVLDTLGLETVHLVGHDWGAAVAWSVAGRHPERIRTVTAVSVPHPRALSWALRNDSDQRRRSSYFLLFRRRWLAERVLLAFDARVLGAVCAGMGGGREAGCLARMRQPGALTAALNWYRAGSVGDAGPIEVPAALVWSDADPALGRAGAERCAEHVVADFQFTELAGVNHWVPERAPAELARAILARIDIVPA